MNTTGDTQGNNPTGKGAGAPPHVWVPVIVAAISAVSAIGAAIILRPAPPATQAPSTLAAVPATQGGGAGSTPVETATATAPPAAPGAPAPSGATAAPTPAIDYRQQVLGYLDTQHKTLTDAGYARDAGTDDWVGLLQVGTPKVWEVELARGVEYQVVGVCDSDCKNVDMEIYDASGRFMGGDTLVDDYPRVQFRPAQSGAHTVKVWLRDCTSADGTHSCLVAARILRR